MYRALTRVRKAHPIQAPSRWHMDDSKATAAQPNLALTFTYIICSVAMMIGMSLQLTLDRQLALPVGPKWKTDVSQNDQPQQDQPQNKRSNDMDRHVGLRVRECRIMAGLSQQKLAEMIGVTYQQAHKYERGLNRISAGRLFEIAQALAVEPSWFFEGFAEQGKPNELAPRQRLCLEFARSFSLIKDEKQQEVLGQMARSLAT